MSADSLNLLVHGQGVFLFNTTAECSFLFQTCDKTDGLLVIFNSTEILVSRMSNKDKYVSQAGSGGLCPKSGAFYWFSLDSQNQRLYGGVGEPRMETMCYSYVFDRADRLWEVNKIFLESLVSIHIQTPALIPLRILKNPILRSVPLRIKGTDQLTMEDIAGTTFLPSASLVSAAQTLHASIAGTQFVLNTPDFPDFTDAIEYSIKTPGLWCNTRLKEKATEFGDKPNPLETYLRITLGQNNGDSPGISYVMEIWPVGHYSPIHNHGNANAIIRVLHGSIHVSLYPFLCDDPDGVAPFAETDFSTDEITWLSANLNQVHKLKNVESNTHTCITIQCYKYDKQDHAHYDYFDYLGDHNEKEHYEPDSDMDFLAFKKKIREEWTTRLQTAVAHVSCGCFGW